ncbi:hypothetical protein AG1IA_08018 [Rhizoctonia solani AG-1 IA]|uniref:Uncharacterized protein n=1 Tax=Thanatephorus cucumeris (strain AG1-IA) TaxID=983506 RepID=L8WMF2_THACA|nr:hypothetical protein AG1IA_08018 [Rhizoctonia solani AG-1 IA]
MLVGLGRVLTRAEIGCCHRSMGTEFRTWLVEECKMNPESMSKDATKKQFARFVEDYNTATLPHPKFYNMETYERQMSSLRNGMTADVITDSYDLNADLAAHTSRHKRPVAEAETYLSKEQLQELRKVQNERTQAGKMKLLGMEIKGTMGVRMDAKINVRVPLHTNRISLYNGSRL